MIRKLFAAWTKMADEASEAGRYRTLYEVEHAQLVLLEARNQELEHWRASFKMTQTQLELGRIKYFAYASDAQIRTWAKANLPDEPKVQEIARLTRMLAREQARVEELSGALDQANQALRQKWFTLPTRRAPDEMLDLDQ